MARSFEITTRPPGRLLATSATALALELVVQLAVGLILSLRYQANVAHAHADVRAMHAGGVLGWLQAVHYWGSAVLIAHSILHVAALVFAHRVGREDRAGYYFGIATVLAAVGFQVTGNVLPFDRHGVETAVVEASIAARAPGVGPTLSHLALHGSGFGEATLGWWYTLHRVALPALAVVAIGLYGASRRRMSARDLRLAALPLAIVAILGAVVASPLGTGATAADYELQGARVSWYMWPLHSTMRMADALIGAGWVGALLVPAVLVGWLLLLPLVRPKPAISWSVIAVIAFLIVVAGMGWGGASAPLVGTRDPVTPTTAEPSKTTKDVVDAVLAARGRKAFNDLPCAGCHGVDGKEANGGPVLTNVWRRHAEAEYYIRYVKNPTSVAPDSTMPAFPKVAEADLRAIAEYLRFPH